MSKQDDTDPLPYTQVDRAVLAKTPALAELIGTTDQHAIGSLVRWWSLHSEPRELERLLADGTGEILLSREDCIRTFRVASGGKVVDPADLAVLGLVEKRGKDLFRVRGMSRAFAPIAKRIHLRELGRQGGLASASAKADARPPARPSAQARARPQAKRAGGVDPPLSVSGQRSTVRDQRSTADLHETAKQESLPGVPEAPPPERDISFQEEIHRFFLERRALKSAEIGIPFAPDKDPNVVVINTVFAKIDKACQKDTRLVHDVVIAYFAETYPGAYDPPYPFSAFCSDKVWPKLLEKIRSEERVQ